ncbi:trehalose-phosphatase [Acidisphaera sp. S103]|uniref:trehalose-phosphatase n=1 Tax=Acidisphaera sp. S103 TaxID=1747223 RepID=UPI00131DE009|nr:trehalose-phosphatase [Acidisphaera sp. S103]
MDVLPPFHRAALLLDMDGTLIDLAATPDAVVVPVGLPVALGTLRDALGGALAIVTGRPIETVDRLFGDAPGAVAGEHGGAIRHHRGGSIERPDLPVPPAVWLEEAETLVRAFPGALLERKARGFALHYRQAQEARDVFRTALTELIGASSGFQLHPAHMLWEVRPIGADKGSAVMALMREAPFAGRLPVFIGDDVTDEDGMRACRKLGGAGYRVDEVFLDPAGVRSWVGRSAELGCWGPLP